ncbi:BaiN/RdsA family NAD(P)/FAD-dependent oxidoreductase [Singulisphaera acidiphila]|uniref:Flavoprotein, HI0933 family n=1 Tax=Singulisphaera acidiphila (strain ATCC BAA-1392 / DSM 18658 / VKM B-2454 / MOB10) TaxID=886293 RepID=L0DKZ3_SINAD|nr:NAD(P)/FAD-dependent oxidoreductase [Singulisphaera acidiphila]AGA29495.1 flavoprotein, HI0933 family [Singulisphaera acidiphila DSM 18658]
MEVDSPPFDVDAVILGAGAAGLIAAIRAAELDRRVLLLEKTRRPGVKILMSGGTRCNITNARGLRNLGVISGPIDPAYDPHEARGAQSIQQAFGAGGRFLGPALRALNVERTIALFESEGVATKVEGNGKVFPVSDRAADVLHALLQRLGRSTAEVRCNSPVREVEPLGEGFAIRLADSTVTARRVILAVGGQSFPGCGTTGDGYAIARRFGHTIVEPKPALVPIRVTESWVPELKGITIPDALARIQGPTGPVLLERREAVLFAHFGLTGPAILDVSRAVARHQGPGLLDLVLDFLPTEKRETLDQQLQSACRAGRRQVVGLLPPTIPRRLAESLLAASGIAPDRMGPDLSRDERHRLLTGLKALRLPVAGTLGFAKAEVTSGGVALDEVEADTLESKLCPGLHFAGEVLDLDGLIGGYNFQAAWSTGWLAGSSV